MIDHLQLFVCENFSEEARLILANDAFSDVKLVVFPSNCGHPPVSLAEIVGLAEGDVEAISICLFGSCCAAELDNLAINMQYCKINHLEQCFELVCNKSIIDDLIKNGAYLLTPGWLAEWPEKIKTMGFNREIARDFFAQSARKVVLLDTVIKEDSLSRLQQFAEFVGLPYETIAVGLDYMRLIFSKAIADWKQTVLQTKFNLSIKNNSDCAMAMDVLGRLASLSIAKDSVEDIKELFCMLFSPREIVFIPFPDAFSEDGNSKSSDGLACACFWQDVRKFGFRLTDSKDGFYLALHTTERYFGIMKLDQVMFPSNLEKYLNLALSVVKVCSLAMNNASITKKLRNEIHEKEKLVIELQEALSQIRTLHGTIPICSYCRQLRDDAGAWTVLEDYISEHSDAVFSHGICPDCFKKEMEILDKET